MKLPKIETLVIIVFFGCVALWAMSKCSSERTDFKRRAQDNEEEELPVRRDTQEAPRPAPGPQAAPPLPAEQQQPVNVQRPAATAPVSTSAPARTPATTPANAPATAPATAPSNSKPATANSKYSTLYVSIDGLKVRKEPGLKGETIAKLALHEPVTFLNQKTEWTQQISLGYEKVTDHWVKVRTKSGKEGWVFGAGVHYYKMKRQGVME